MPRNSTGIYSLPQAPFTPGTVISSTAVNSDLSDIATALTQSVATTGVSNIALPLKNPSGTVALPGISFGAQPDTGIRPSGTDQMAVSSNNTDIAIFNANNVGFGQSGNQFYYGNGAILAPVGIMSNFGGSTAPTGWLLCYGQSVSRSDYPELFIAIGVNFGSVDGSHFNIPDMRGRVGAGKDNMGGVAAGNITFSGSGIDGSHLGVAGGQQNVILDTTQIPSHTHTFTGDALATHTHNYSVTSPNNVLTGGSGSAPQANIAQFPVGTTATSATSGGTPTGTNSNTGSGLSHLNVQPTVILNTIIFAGRP